MTLDTNEILNAFRYGTPPQKHAIAMLTGRKKEVDDFKEALETISSNTGAVKLLVGDYGVGKSFLLESFKHIALTEDYVVSKFQVNSGFRLNKIEDIYYAIMHNLSLKSIDHRKASFDDLFNLWIENLKHVPDNRLKANEINFVCEAISQFNRNYARAFLTYIRSRIKGDNDAIQASSAWLSGEQHIPHAIKQKIDLIGSMDRNSSMDFLKAFAKLIQLLDYKGLVVFIDETDLILNERSDFRAQAYQNLKYLIDLTATGELTGILFVFSGTKELIKSEDKGVSSLIPLAQRLDINSKGGHPNIWSIEPLDHNSLIELTGKTLDLYKGKFSMTQGLTASHLFHQINPENQISTRNYIIELIQHLDNEKR